MRDAVIDTVVGNHPVGNHPVGNHPVGNHPVGNHPVGNHPVGNHPVGDVVDVVLDEVVDPTRYPLGEPGSAGWRAVVARVRAELAADGCCVLPDFVRPELHGVLDAQGEGMAPHAYHGDETVNVYNTAPDPTLPPEHPGRVEMRRGNAFVARDRIPASALVHRLYTSAAFRRFVADCVGCWIDGGELYELADPLAGLVLNVLRPGREHPWHFDTNEFTVTLLTRPGEGGGVFEYCPGIRAPGAENLAAVRAVLDGRAPERVRRLAPRPGDLQIFAGRYALHRVTEVTGARDRHTAIFAYSARPGVVGTVARTRQLFGRVTEAHRAAPVPAGRVDELLI